MSRFVFLFFGLGSQPAAEDAETAAYNQKWGAWMASLAQEGILESGLPLEPRAVRVTADTVSDAPLATQDIYGYMVVKAESLDAAVALSRQAPHMALGGATIIRPCIEVAY
jgi:hypothetical protein